MATFPPADRITLYERLVATRPDVDRKGASMPYTSVNGNMFSYLNSDGILALRLDTADREAFIERYGATLAIAHGVTQKEYVSVPDDLFERTQELAPYFAASADSAQTLKPKATKRPGTARPQG